MIEETVKIGNKCPHCGKELIVLKSSIEKKNGDKVDILCVGTIKAECCKKEVRVQIHRGN